MASQSPEMMPGVPELGKQELRTGALLGALGTHGFEDFEDDEERTEHHTTYYPVETNVRKLNFHASTSHPTSEGFIAQISIDYIDGRQRHIFVDGEDGVKMQLVDGVRHTDLEDLSHDRSGELFREIGNLITNYLPCEHTSSFWAQPHTVDQYS